MHLLLLLSALLTGLIGSVANGRAAEPLPIAQGVPAIAGALAHDRAVVAASRPHRMVPAASPVAPRVAPQTIQIAPPVDLIIRIGRRRE